MKVFLLATLLFSQVASAGTGSLWCAMSPYGTPTETSLNAATPYRLIQIDMMGKNEIQIDIEDLYHSTSDIFKANLVEKTDGSISGLALGYYKGKRTVILKLEDGRILVEDGSMTYKCEIPGDYRTYYK